MVFFNLVINAIFFLKIIDQYNEFRLNIENLNELIF